MPNGCPNFHFLITESGQGKVEIDGKSMLLKKGQGILSAPFTPLIYRACDTSDWQTGFITIQGFMADKITDMIGTYDYFIIDENSTFDYFAWLSQVIALQTKKPLPQHELSKLCYAFILSFQTNSQHLSSNKSQLFELYVKPTMAQIEKHYAEKIQIHDLASDLFITPQYLAKLFKRFLGVSASKFLLEIRMTKAKELLVNQPDLSIQKVCNLVGIDDASHFIALFKKENGLTPLVFRTSKQLRK
ncbi:AraC family transcriptional regulator [Lactococcus hodotermopsidis]|nr:AraC family transcriptional regulator [Lactococcus hodotermopsidis]